MAIKAINLHLQHPLQLQYVVAQDDLYTGMVQVCTSSGVFRGKQADWPSWAADNPFVTKDGKRFEEPFINSVNALEMVDFPVMRTPKLTLAIDNPEVAGAVGANMVEYSAMVDAMGLEEATPLLSKELVGKAYQFGWKEAALAFLQGCDFRPGVVYYATTKSQMMDDVITA